MDHHIVSLSVSKELIFLEKEKKRKEKKKFDVVLTCVFVLNDELNNRNHGTAHASVLMGLLVPPSDRKTCGE